MEKKMDEKWKTFIWKMMLEKPLKEVIVDANRNLAQVERARLVLNIAKELGIEPTQIVDAELKWK